MEIITAAEANKQAKEMIEKDFLFQLERLKQDIELAVNFGRMKICYRVSSFLMREKLSNYLEKLGYLISYPQDDDGLRFENNGCNMYIYWG